MEKNLLSIADLSEKDILGILELAKKVKADKTKYSEALKGKCIGLIFQKPSNRTRVSFEIGMIQLGGYAIYLGPSEIEMGVREPVKDVACVLARYLDGMVARTFKHEDLKELARHATVPVINGLSDLAHPCQALTDIFTIKEKAGKFKGVKLAYVGDGNNVLNSLMCAAAKVGLDMKVATPKGYEPAKKVVELAKGFSVKSGSKLQLSDSAEEAVKGADVVYTDVWVSMGQEGQKAKRMEAFKGFQINDEIMNTAKKGCVVMHCLPARRGEEITDSVIDSKASVVYDQAENRLHVQKAILLKLLG
ncbi:MAG: ornithine carbamoyltransferase [Candidatus Omnitrophica bacterium]|nr:ornithine carbamoyltransferase [Candidatus Omnitrophota bacterium]